MTEHRLIMRMVSLIGAKSRQIEETGNVDVMFIDTALDFIRIYADRTHHGKEEDILFRDLGKKELAVDHRRIMNELIEEHDSGRRTVRGLDQEKGKYAAGDRSAAGAVVEKMKDLVRFYPEHIRKEDKVFFPTASKYFSEQEQEGMLTKFWEFDKKMIHIKYQGVVEGMERQS